MNRLLMLPLLALLTACVSYYQPESALEDGVYYAEDDPAYRYNPDDYYYSRAVVYPWSSLDSFYFGYWPYPGYGYGYWPHPGYSFSFVYPDEFGFAAGYYGFYSPWYSRGFYTYYQPPIWRPYRNDCYQHGRCVKHDDDRDAGDDAYADAGGQNNVYPVGGGEENAFYSHNVKNKMGGSGHPTTKRYISKTTSGRAGYQGGAERKYELTKTGKPRAKTGYPSASGPAKVNPVAASSSRGERRTSSTSGVSPQVRQSPSSSPPAPSRSSDSARSPRHRDRD